MEQVNGRDGAVDVLRIVLALLVVGVHTFFLKDLHPLFVHLTRQGIFRIAVPTFFVISGYYFFTTLSHRRAGRWFRRVAILYLFWMLFYSYFWFRPDNLTRILLTVLFGHNHLWYLAAVLGAAVMVYISDRVRVPDTAIVVAICLTFVVGVVLEYGAEYVQFENAVVNRVFRDDLFRQNFLFFGFPFFGVGYLIQKRSLFQRVPLRAAVVATAVGIALLLVESSVHFAYSLSRGWFESMASLSIVAPGLFLVALKSQVKTIDVRMAPLATGIYLIHPFMISLVRFVIAIDRTLVLTVVVIAVSTVAAFVLIALNRRLTFLL